ncbi:MAG: synthase subunit epsilon [Phycisphaerales bacterium]|nr:synthase subunit epsilon [Phycisphaerales bacterium]
MPASLMRLKVLLPFAVFADTPGVSRIVAETPAGSFGLLPHRLDCVAALAPGILTYQTQSGDEVFVAVDQGVLVKTGPDVLVSVRRAIGGTDLSRLRDAVQKQFVTLRDDEQSERRVIAKREAGLLRRLVELQRA